MKFELPWLAPHQAFPDPSTAWPLDSDAPGLLAAGGVLDVATLLLAYRQGVFPWFSLGQPILWWSTDPRMVLFTDEYRLHRSLRKEIQSLLSAGRLVMAVDGDFAAVIDACASADDRQDEGTWIQPEVKRAYTALHRAGWAHCLVAKVDGQVAGGLYWVQIGRMLFGESMFSLRPNGSKLALAALVALANKHGWPVIDCQQQTAHLALQGARAIDRADFLGWVSTGIAEDIGPSSPKLRFTPADWLYLDARLIDNHTKPPIHDTIGLSTRAQTP